MTAKQNPGAIYAPDGSLYITLTDGAGNLVDVGAATSETVGTTTISGGTTGQILYDNAGVLGEYTAAAAKTALSLNNVTNDAQTKASIVPNTAPTAGQVPVGNAGGTAYAPVSISGGASLASTGALTVVTNANLTGPITSTGNATAVASQTGTGTTFVMNTSPTLVTPALGTPSACVATNLSGTAANLTAGHVTTNADLTGVITSVGNATSIASQTGTGTKFVVDTSPTLVTPVLGVAAATSVNRVAFTAPATSATLTIADGKTLTDTSALGAVALKGATGGGFAQAAAADLSDTVAKTAWTPTDQSGASVGLTVNEAFYYRIGKLVFVALNVTYQVNADGTTAAISLPVAPVSTTAEMMGSALVLGASGFPLALIKSGGTAAFFITSVTGSAATNVNLSTLNIRASFVYLVA